MKTALAILLIAAFVLACVASVNIFVDSAAVFNPARDSDTVQGALSLIQSGHGALNMENHNERMMKRACALTLPGHRTVALGSSRAAMISADMTGDNDFFNYSVTGASVYDIVAMYSLLYEQGKAPERVIISCDMWWLSDNYDSVRFSSSLADAYCRYAKNALGYAELDEDDFDVLPWYKDVSYDGGALATFFALDDDSRSEAFSIPYFQDNIASLFDSRETAAAVVACDDYLTDAGCLRADGSFCYPASYREESESAVAAAVTSAIKLRILGMNDYNDSNGAAKKLFYDFVKSLCEQGVDVDLVLTPLHPLTYEAIENEARYAAGLLAEPWFKSLADELGLDVSGSFDPGKCLGGLDGGDFYDAYHCRLERVKELVAALGEAEE